MKVCLTYLFLLISAVVLGQTPISNTRYIQAYQSINQDSSIIIDSKKVVSAIAIKADNEGLFSITFNNDTIQIPKDQDVDEPTYFLSFEQPRKIIKIIAQAESSFNVFLIFSGTSPSLDHYKQRRHEANECDQVPVSVQQSEWRSGLPEPNYSRSFHEVFHNVVHHSAGSNSNTNYTQVVRDIYLYHTQVNGWSDIGYNYLIAQNGTLFAGRDPGSGSQDNVRGAHFCGSNTGTLGICLLGNYETASPSSSSMGILEELLTYQLISQGRNPFETNNHPLGNLQAVVGHRDGCATLCPGENVYSILDQIRSSVENDIMDCQFTEPLAIEADTTLIQVGQILELRALGSYDEFKWFIPKGFPFGLTGKSIEVSYSTPGLYDVTLIGTRGNIQDTLISQNFIQVSLLENEPVIFPNPVSSNEEIKIDFKNQIVFSQLHDINGKLLDQWSSKTLNLKDLEPGTYFLTMQGANRVFRKKVVIL